MYWPTPSTRIKANEDIKFRPFIRPEISKIVYLSINILGKKGNLQISTKKKRSLSGNKNFGKKSVTASEHILRKGNYMTNSTSLMC